MSRSARRLILGAAFAVLASGAAQSGPACQLQRLASVEMTTEVDGEVSVPALLNGEPGRLLVDTGGIQSVIGETFATRLKLVSSPSPGTFSLFGGVRLTQVTHIDTLVLGDMHGHDLPLLIAPFTVLHSGTIGMLAPDIMSNYDVEFDFAAGLFNIFSQDHCRSNVVYWTQQPVAVVPFTTDAGNHMLIHIMVDGKEMTAAVDTGADRTSMTLSAAREIFGFAADDPKLKLIDHVSINGTRATALYQYPFQTMTFEGIQVKYPGIDIVDGSRFDPRGPQIILGIGTLRQLHMYIAYGERNIYLTAAEAR